MPILMRLYSNLLHRALSLLTCWCNYWLRAEWTGFESQQTEGLFFPPLSTVAQGNVHKGLFPVEQSTQGRELKTRLYLMLVLRRSGELHPISIRIHGVVALAVYVWYVWWSWDGVTHFRQWYKAKNNILKGVSCILLSLKAKDWNRGTVHARTLAFGWRPVTWIWTT